MKENNEKKMKYCDEISKLIKAFPKDIAALRNENEIEGVRKEKERLTADRQLEDDG